MSKIFEGLRAATINMIMQGVKLHKIDAAHILKQKLGNNPVDTEADDNIYHECRIRNVDSLLICGYGKDNDKGIGASRDVDYSSYTVKIGAAIKDVPLLRTNGPFSNSTTELERFLGIWNKYYKLRISSYGIGLNDKPVNPFSVISSVISKDDRNIHLEFMIANPKLVESSPVDMKYYGDIIIYAYENLGYGSSYSQLDKYSELSENRTTLSAITGEHDYAKKLLTAVEDSFDHIYFVLSELESIRPNLSITRKMLWVSNNFKQKK